MDFALWFAALPLWASAMVVVGVPTVLAMFGPVLVRRRVALERLTTNNEVAGFKFAVLGVVYAVLLGFAVIVVWEKFHDAESAVMQEAGTSATMFRMSDGLGGEAGAALHARLKEYVKIAIESDWPAMARAGLSRDGTRAMNDLYATVLAGPAQSPRDTIVMQELLTQLDQLTQARRTRIALAEGIVPGVVWTVLFLGAVVTVGFTFFFGTFHLRAQVLMTGLLAVTVFMGLFVILAINHPFTGMVSVTPEPLQLVLREFGGGGGD